MEIQCQGCGETVPLGSAKCPHCGAQMPEPAGDVPTTPKATEPAGRSTCPNCGSVTAANVDRCPHCGHESAAFGQKASIAEKVLLRILFVLVGVPAGLFGACTGFFAVGGGTDGGFIALGVLGLGIFALLLWLWVRSLKS
jgi:RNA polymerase subunit RPABC4/transcription elongation factor Spt4